MNQYYQDNMLFGMNPSSYLHRYAVNGKVSGNLACISEIKNAAVVLYSPRGCGFHYRCLLYTSHYQNYVILKKRGQ